MTYSSVLGITDTEEGTTPELSPTYSRLINGTYQRVIFNQQLPFTNFRGSSDGYNTAIGYGVNSISNTSNAPYLLVYFGNSDKEPSFTDYAPTSNVNARLNYQFKSRTITYDESTKTYTNTSNITITNSTLNELEIKEILLAFSNQANAIQTSAVCVTRDTLGENSFTIGAQESVNFELTIKYTIAEPLQ